MRRGIQGLLVLLLLSAMGRGALGQDVNASVYGTVQDPSGGVIPGAEVELRNVGTNRVYRTVTDESGNFTISQIPIGQYEASAELPGFQRTVVTDIVLRVMDRRRIQFTLQIGDITEQLTISASLLTVDTATGTTSNIITDEDLVRLPSVGRNVAPFALVMPGVVSDTPGDRFNNRHAVSGIRPTHNAWLLDGGYNIDTGGNWAMPMAPNMETVAEFRAIRNNYGAEFGTGGGSQFNVITKSGTNRFSGALSWYHRNERLNARDFFSPGKEKFRDNDYGGSLGGPVIIPGVYNGRDRTFFFVFFGTRTERSDQRFFAKLPETAYRNGNFSALGRTINDPVTGAPFPGNIIPADRIDPNARIYVGLYPGLNYSDSLGNNFTATQPRKFNLPQQNYRIDHNFSNNHRLFGRYSRDDRLLEQYFAPGFDFLEGREERPINNTVINFYSNFGPNLINEASFTRGHNRIKQFRDGISRTGSGFSIPQLVQPDASTYPLKNLNLDKIPDRAPNLTLVNYASMSIGAPWSNSQSIFSFKDNLTWIRGNHTLKWGVDYAYEKKFEPADTNVFGAFAFDGRFTGDAFADLLLGRAASYTESTAVSFNDNRRHSFEAFIDDSWRASQRLTLNLGVRYSYFPPASEATGRHRSFWPTAYDPARAVTVTPQGQVVKDSGDRLNGIVDPKDWWDYPAWNFAPRLGFSYDLFGTGRTALRGGYGIFRSREILGAFILMASNPPFQQVLEFFNTTFATPGGGDTRLFDLVVNLSSIDPNQKIPYTQQWNLNIQHGIARGLVLEVAYSGSRGLHMMRSRDINQGPLSAQAAAGQVSANYLRPYKGWGLISHREQSYTSNYHGLQMGLNRNFAQGLGVKVAYTWSKAIDNADFAGGIYGVSPYYPNDTDPNGQRGPANFDATHRFVTSYIYEIPWLRERRDPLGWVFGGWILSGLTTFQTGLPYTPAAGRDRAGIGYATGQRPVVSGNPNLDSGDRTLTRWFDTSVFSNPAAGTLPATGRNFMRLPGIDNWDLSIAKKFVFHENTSLNVSLESFNVWNHTQFAAVGSNFAAPSSFGRITSARSPRSMQLGLRFSF